jgi:hypothetical protein
MLAILKIKILVIFLNFYIFNVKFILSDFIFYVPMIRGLPDLLQQLFCSLKFFESNFSRFSDDKITISRHFKEKIVQPILKSHFRNETCPSLLLIKLIIKDPR